MLLFDSYKLTFTDTNITNKNVPFCNTSDCATQIQKVLFSPFFLSTTALKLICILYAHQIPFWKYSLGYATSSSSSTTCLSVVLYVCWLCRCMYTCPVVMATTGRCRHRYGRKVLWAVRDASVVIRRRRGDDDGSDGDDASTTKIQCRSSA